MDDKYYNRESFEKMQLYIERKRILGKIPLFIIGAGVSSGKVPLMNDIFGYFANIDDSNNSEKKNIKTYAQRLYQNKKYQTVATSAQLFNILQNSKNSTTRDLWKSFTHAFLLNKIGNNQELWNLIPNDFHNWVAEQIVRDHLPAFCVSLNYDGLTVKAISAIATKTDPEKIDILYPCRILSAPEEIDNFWSSHRTMSQIYPIIKLRGDIFYASCSNEGCKSRGHLIPTYEFLHERIRLKPPQTSSNGNEKSNFQQGALKFEEHESKPLIPCPDCRSDMDLVMDFPGHQRKECHSKKVVEAIYRYIFPSLSCVVACGISGKWDKEIVDFLRFSINEKDLDIYCLSHSKNGPSALRYELGGIAENRFKHVYIDFKEWHSPKPINRSQSVPSHTYNSRAKILLFDDRFWLEDREELKLRLSRNVKSEWFVGMNQSIENKEIFFQRTSEERDLLFSSLLQMDTYKLMDRICQLGIKDKLLGTAQEDKHTRRSHCQGTRLIGRAWWESIASLINTTNYGSMDQEKLAECLEIALLLHDAGHLPFSHLMEEVYGELNWTRIAQLAKYRHDENPLEQISEGDREKLKLVVKKILNIDDAEIQNYYGFIQDLIAGISGVPFLDAIVNSPLDADKIDYIFRDMKFVEKSTRLNTKQEWLEGFLSNISLSQEGLLRLNGESALFAKELLEERQFLYKTLYLRPDIRAFERIAATIITTWLTSRISYQIKSDLSNGLLMDPDLREYKGKKAYDLLLTEFNKGCTSSTDLPDEFHLLLKLCDDLMDTKKQYFFSKKASSWFGQLKDILKKIDDAKKEEAEKTIKEQFDKMIVDEPFLIPIEKTKEAREIVRRLYIDYPCGVLIDIVNFPNILSSSRARCLKNQVAECFLVPDKNPNKWSKRDIARVPLSECNFKELERPFAQVVMIDTVPEAGVGQFVCQLFKEYCQWKGIEILGVGSL